MNETSTPFEGRSGAMRTSPWLASEDLDGLETPYTIECVMVHRDVVMQDGRKQPRLFSLKFAGKPRQLVLNATNRKTLSARFGPDTKSWAGKEIVLYVQDGVKHPTGGKCKGIRIK